MTTSYITQLTTPTAGPIPARGRHAELLADLEQAANKLLKLVELERSGVFDNYGQPFWLASDPVLSTARDIAIKAEQRLGAIKDAAATR